jgi:hypothetical protein
MNNYDKIKNAADMGIGMVGTFILIRSMFHHQVVVYSTRRQQWVPTLFPLLLSVWLFIFGLVGFIRECKKNKSGQIR